MLINFCSMMLQSDDNPEINENKSGVATFGNRTEQEMFLETQDVYIISQFIKNIRRIP